MANKIINDLKKYFETEEGKESIKKFFEQIEKSEKFLTYQTERVYNWGHFSKIINKTIIKYNSKKYIDRWRSRGIEPPESLYFLYFNVAKVYGRVCTIVEWDKWGNTFTSEMYFYSGYYFNKMDGQGTVIKIIKNEL